MIADTEVQAARIDRLGLIQAAHQRALDRQTQRRSEHTMTIDLTDLTETQLSILKTGMTCSEFVLTSRQRASRPQRMVDAGLIVPAGKGHHTLTDKGRAVYQAHQQAVDSRATPDHPTATHESEAEMTQITELSETQIGILEKGSKYETFALTRQEAGKAIGALKSHKMVIPTGIKGRWRLTDKGLMEYEQIKAARSTVMLETPDPINLADPALGAKDPVLAQVQALAAQRQIRINQLETDIDDLNRLLDTHARTVTSARVEAAADPALSESLRIYGEIVAALATLMDEDRYIGQPLEYIAWLRERASGFATFHTSQEWLLQMKADDGSDLSLVAYVEQLRKTAATADQAAGTVESLRRQLSEANIDLQTAARQSAANDLNAFLACVLDEVSQVNSDVADYRDSREKSYRVMQKMRQSR